MCKRDALAHAEQGLNLGNKTEIFDGNAYTASFTYHDATLRMYLHWIVNSKNAEFPLQYEMV